MRNIRDQKSDVRVVGVMNTRKYVVVLVKNNSGEVEVVLIPK